MVNLCIYTSCKKLSWAIINFLAKLKENDTETINVFHKVYGKDTLKKGPPMTYDN